jgi:hypothetical protein
MSVLGLTQPVVAFVMSSLRHHSLLTEALVSRSNAERAMQTRLALDVGASLREIYEIRWAPILVKLSAASNRQYACYEQRSVKEQATN